METLLCRRFDLARSSGQPFEDTDPALRHHLDECQRCQEVLRLDQLVAGALAKSRPSLDGSARRRIEALVAVKAREETPRASRRPALMIAAAVALCLVAGASAWSFARSHEPVPAVPDELAQTPPIEPGEPLSGLSSLVARHGGDAEAPLPAGALVYSARLPQGLAGQLTPTPEGTTAVSWDGLPGPAVDDATLFVLARDRVTVDPIIAELLDETSSLTLSWGPSQVTLASRADQLFVIVASPRGVSPPSRGPYL